MLRLADVGAREWRTDNGPFFAEAVEAVSHQKASNSGGGVILVDGQYEFTTPLIVSGQERRVAFVGTATSPNSCRLVWMGSDAQPAITITTVSGWQLRDLSLYRGLNPSVDARGNHVGLWATHSASGSGGGMACFENVELAGWHRAIRIGDDAAGAAQSEIEYRRLTLSYNDIGLRIEGGNSLDHHLRGLYGVDNGILVDNLGSDCCWVDGGSATASHDADFVAHQAGAFAVSRFRSEGPGIGGRHVVRAGYTSQPTVITIGPGCRFAGNPDPVVPLITGGGGCSLMTIIGCQISGRVSLNTGGSPGSSLTMIWNAIEDEYPFRSVHAGIRWRLEGNTRIGVSPPQAFADGSGLT